MNAIKHFGRDGALLLLLMLGAYGITLLVQMVAGLVIDVGEMLL